MKKGEVYKTYYYVPEDVKEKIREKDTPEERQAYFDFLQDCIENGICSRCGDEIVIDETWLKDEIGEIKFSGMCKDCQREEFGM